VRVYSTDTPNLLELIDAHQVYQRTPTTFETDDRTKEKEM